MTGTLRWTPSEGLVLKDILAEIKDLLELHGSLKIKGDSINGEFTCVALGASITSIREGTTGGFKVKDDRGTLDFTVTGTPQLLLDNIELRVPGVLQTPIPAMQKAPGDAPAPAPVKTPAPAPAPAPAAPSKDTDKALEELLRQ